MGKGECRGGREMSWKGGGAEGAKEQERGVRGNGNSKGGGGRGGEVSVGGGKVTQVVLPYLEGTQTQVAGALKKYHLTM